MSVLIIVVHRWIFLESNRSLLIIINRRNVSRLFPNNCSKLHYNLYSLIIVFCDRHTDSIIVFSYILQRFTNIISNLLYDNSYNINVSLIIIHVIFGYIIHCYYCLVDIKSIETELQIKFIILKIKYIFNNRIKSYNYRILRWFYLLIGICTCMLFHTILFNVIQYKPLVRIDGVYLLYLFSFIISLLLI